MLQDLFTSTALPIADVAVRLGAAMLLASIIGIERELRDKSAGLRTHMLVGLAAASFVVLALELVSAPTWSPDARIDPMRALEAVVAGVAFIGAGVIVRDNGSKEASVRGLTTGTSLWLAGAVGLACGLGHVIIGVVIVGWSLLALWLLGLLEQALDRE